ncbi:TLC domain-containing protein 4-B-like [Branchiostoma lanceolatum]|uniref:TLC domain-containing protein 4-B-like n=1 Tax=Branchiostoma lanceolatum TaxID=7740 RepID=UPI0034554B86
MAFETLHVVATLGSILTWIAVFKKISPAFFVGVFKTYGELSAERKILVDDYFMAAVHATVTAILSWYAYTCTELPADGVWFNSPIVRFTSALYLGYIMADVVILLQNPQLATKAFIAHHITSLFTAYIGASYPAMPYYANISYMMEISNPTVNLRTILKELGYGTSKYYVWNGAAMLVTFFFSRVLLTAIATFNLAKVMWTHNAFHQLPFQVSLCYIFGCGLFNVLNYYWFSKICKGFVKHVWGKKPQ